MAFVSRAAVGPAAKASAAGFAPSLKGRALRYLSQREHSRVELERKLRRWVQGDDEGTAAQQISAALDELTAKGLLSDARTAESVLNSKGARFGVRRLRQELQAKGLDAELVGATLSRAKTTELERAREVWRRKFGTLPGDAREHAKQARFLAARGFLGDVISRILQGADGRD